MQVAALKVRLQNPADFKILLAESSWRLIFAPRVMKAICFVLLGGAALAQDVTFTNRVVTFTNLEGRLFPNVTLVKANRDGVIWHDGASGGLASYTNLSPALLKEWGIPLERIDEARTRAGKRALADAQRRAALAAQYAAQREAQRKAKEEWDAGASARALEAQRQADLQAIKTLEAEIEVAEPQAEWMDAMAPKGAYGDAAVVEAIMAQRRRANVALAEVKESKRKLERLKAAYAEKYSTK